MEKIKNIWISGYRSYELGIFQNTNPKKKIIEDCLIDTLVNYCENGLQWILTGGQLGVDQYAVEAANSPLLKEYNLKTAVMLPFNNMDKNWNEKNRQLFNTTIQQADYHNTISNQDYLHPSQFTNWQQFMLQHTDASLLVYDVEHPGKCQYEYLAIKKFQQQHDYPIQLIDMYDLQDFVDSQKDF